MKRKNNKKRNSLIIVTVILFAILTGAIIYFVNSYNKDNALSSSSSSSETISSSQSSDTSKSSAIVIPNIDDGGFDANKSGVPVMMYHNVMTDTAKKNHPVLNNDLTVTTTELEGQLAALKDKNYSSISIDTLLDYMKTGKEVPYKSVVLTFDDGYLSNTELAAPILRKYGFKATVFVITEGINTPSQPYNSDILQYFTKTDMDKNKDVFTYASHSNTLVGHNTFKTLSLNQMIKEIDDGLSKNSSPYFAYPLGHYTDELIPQLKSRGYKCAFTIHNGYAKKNGNVFLIPRFYVASPMSANKFINLIETGIKS